MAKQCLIGSTAAHAEGPVRVIQIMGRMMGGGVEATVLNHYRHVDRLRVQFDFMVGEDSEVVPVSEIEALGGRVFTVPCYQHVTEFVHGVREVIRTTGDPIIHSHLNALSPIPLSVARAEHVPVRIAHSHSTAAPGETLKNAAKAVLKPLAGIAPTDYAACSLHAATWLFGEKAVAGGRVHLVRNAIDLPRFAYDCTRRLRVRERLGISENTHVVGQVGRLCPQKNQLFLVPVVEELARQHRNTVVLMAGEGDLRPRIEREIAQRGLNDQIRLLGVRSDIADLYQAMDVLAMPSTYEGLGMVAIEAQTAGLRVVASDAVPAETNLTDLVEYAPLTATSREWAAMLAPRVPSAPRRDRLDEVAARGYDIETSGRELTEWYLSLARRSERSGDIARHTPQYNAPVRTQQPPVLPEEL